MSSLLAFVLAIVLAWMLLCGLYWAITGFDRSEFWVCVGAATVVSLVGGAAFFLLGLAVAVL